MYRCIYESGTQFWSSCKQLTATIWVMKEVTGGGRELNNEELNIL
jgi:hypothetical protein